MAQLNLSVKQTRCTDIRIIVTKGEIDLGRGMDWEFGVDANYYI